MSDQIENRRDGIGVPSDIYKHDRPLNSQQQELLDKLSKTDRRAEFDKSEVSMADLSALTAKTGDEFAMFTLGSRRLVVRGDSKSVPITTQDAAELNRQGYKWSGHTHVGGEKIDLIQSIGDEAILREFKQPTGVIYNSIGEYNTFGKN